MYLLQCVQKMSIIFTFNTVLQSFVVILQPQFEGFYYVSQSKEQECRFVVNRSPLWNVICGISGTLHMWRSVGEQQVNT
jgi:hypothetical protein